MRKFSTKAEAEKAPIIKSKVRPPKNQITEIIMTPSVAKKAINSLNKVDVTKPVAQEKATEQKLRRSKLIDFV